MFNIIGKVLAAVFVIIGVVSPIAGCWLLFTRKPQVDFYLSHAFGSNSFSKLDEDQKKAALAELDEKIRVSVEQHALPPTGTLVQPTGDQPKP